MFNPFCPFQNRRQVESSGDEGSDSATSAARKPKSPSKRKATGGTASASSKRQKVTTAEVQPSAEEDPVRKYCVGKLKGIISNIFQKQRPYTKPDEEGAEEDEEAEEEHKRRNEVKAGKYAEEVEEALFENYAEILPGKVIKTAGGKYK